MNKPREPERSETGNGKDELNTSEVTSGILDLSNLMDDQRRFFEWLYTTPELQAYQRYWKIQPSPQMDVELAKQAIGTASSGEAHMLRFLAGVWLGSNTFDFDFIEAVRSLDDQELRIIQSWIQSPFFP